MFRIKTKKIYIHHTPTHIEFETDNPDVMIIPESFEQFKFCCKYLSARACGHPERVQKLIMLSPALIWPDFAQAPPRPVSVPTVVYHGVNDELIPLELVRPLAEQVFLDLTFHEVDDDHGLKATVQAIDWSKLVSDG